MDIKVDPREVVEHLHELGFSNITNEQLKEFIKDLKKLIKYDIRSCRSQNIPNEYSYIQNSSGTFQSVKSSYRETDTSNSNSSRILRENSNYEISKESISHKSDETGSSSSSSGESTSSDNTSDSSGPSQCVIRSKAGKSNDTQQKKLRSAFIRTWNLRKGAVPSGTAQRSDPVKLYHQYQSVWKKQKIPGENCHADLRWAVREKMLGGNPNPRTSSSNAVLDVWEKILILKNQDHTMNFELPPYNTFWKFMKKTSAEQPIRTTPRTRQKLKLQLEYADEEANMPRNVSSRYLKLPHLTLCTGAEGCKIRFYSDTG